MFVYNIHIYNSNSPLIFISHCTSSQMFKSPNKTQNDYANIEGFSLWVSDLELNVATPLGALQPMRGELALILQWGFLFLDQMRVAFVCSSCKTFARRREMLVYSL